MAYGWSPLDLANLYAWFRSDAGALNPSSGAAADTEEVETWQDQSGNNRHVTADNDSQRPVFADEELGNLPVVRFSDNGDHLVSGLNFPDGAFTLFFGGQFLDLPFGHSVIEMTPDVRFGLISNNPGIRIAGAGNTRSNTAATKAVPIRVIVTHAGGAGDTPVVYVNGAAASLDTSAAGLGDGLGVWRLGYGVSGAYGLFDAVDIGMVTAALSGGDVATLDQYLSDRMDGTWWDAENGATLIIGAIGGTGTIAGSLTVTTVVPELAGSITGTLTVSGALAGETVVLTRTEPYFPRDIIPQTVTPFLQPGALIAGTHSGRLQRRSFTQAGRIWRETYPPFRASSAEGRKFLALINYFWRNGVQFTIEHYHHLTHTGGGTGTVSVDGANQKGTTLSTTGWGGTNPVLRAGDIIRVGGMSGVLEVQADASHTSGDADLVIDPPIWVGNSPDDEAPITYTGVWLNAYIAAEPNIPDAMVMGHGLLAGLTLTFREAV